MSHYQTNPDAARNRYEKAQAIAIWCWSNGVTPEHLMALDDGQWTALARRAVDKPASHDTQHLAFCFLEIRVAWAAGHPTHPDAHRLVLTLDDLTSELSTRRSRR